MNAICRLRTQHNWVNSQRGQALLEGILALLGLTGLGVALVWTAGLQDLLLLAGHAGRHAVFDHARRLISVPMEPLASVSGRSPDFRPFLHRWSKLDGRRLLQDGNAISMTVSSGPQLSFGATPGGESGAAMAKEWRVGQGVLLQGRIHLSVKLPSLTESSGETPGVLSTEAFLLAGSGHAQSDSDVQRRLAAGSRGWTDASASSRPMVDEIANALAPVDEPWSRGDAAADWLKPWAGWVPARHRKNTGGAYGHELKLRH